MHRILTLGMLLAYWALSLSLLDAPVTIMLLFGVLLVFLKEIPMPGLIKRIAYTLAAASLFIYLTQFAWRRALEMVGIDIGNPAAQTLLSLAGGVAAWICWNRMRLLVNTLRRRHGDVVDIEAV